MKRTLIVLGMALVLVLGATATAHAANPPGTYKLSVSAYFDANGNGWWEAGEPGLPGIGVLLLNTAGESLGVVITGSCGVGSICLPAGTTVYGEYFGFRRASWDEFAPPLTYPGVTEVYPKKSAAEPYVARVCMNGNRCMIFGFKPIPIPQ